MKEIETRVLQHVDENELLRLTKDLVGIPSIMGEETPVARFVAEYLAARGYEVDLQEVERGWCQTIGILKGTGSGKTLMFNGHLDIEPIAEGWTENPFEAWVEQRRIYGAGVRNMKAGVACMIHAAEAIRKAGVKLAGDMIVAAVLGELQGGVGTKYLLDKGYRAEGAVFPEPWGAHYVSTKHGGMSLFSLHVFGRHPVENDLVGINAIDKMINAINAINTMKLTHTPWPLFPGLPWIKIGSIIGGRGKNYDLRGPYRNSDRTTILIHVSTVPGQTTETVRQDLTRVLEELKRTDPGFEYQLNHPPERYFNTWKLDFPAVDIPVDTEVVRTVVSGYRDLTGREPKRVGVPYSDLAARYAGDDTHLWQVGIPSCMYGPAGGGYGVEYADVDEMILCTRVLTLTALRMCG